MEKLINLKYYNINNKMGKIMTIFGVIILLIFILFIIGVALNTTTNGEVKVTQLIKQGERVSWLEDKNIISYDKIGSDNFFDVFILRNNCLTCNKQGFEKNNGNPEIHSSGKYIVFQAENPSLAGIPGPLSKFVGSPGVGINNNIWIMKIDGSQFWQLTDVKNKYGTLHPHFSKDGTKLAWSQMTSEFSDKTGNWEIKIVDFDISSGIPEIKNIQTMRPSNLKLYEIDDFTKDNKQILFSGIPQGGFFYDMEKYIYNLETGKTIKLTNNKEWDEQAHFINDDNQIVWVSSTDNPQTKANNVGEVIENPPLLDYWIMNSDGTGKERLTGFNDINSKDYIESEGGIGLGDFVISENGKTIYGKMRKDRIDNLMKMKFE